MKILKGSESLHLTKSPRGINVIPESDVYRLITRSKMPWAEEFSDWVFEEVLPSIRKHGVYMTPTKLVEMITNPDSITVLLETLKDEHIKNGRLTAQLEVAQPKAPVHGWKG